MRISRRALRLALVLLPVALSVLGLSCNKSFQRGDGGDPGSCTDGAHRCDGLVFSTCRNGQFVTETTCSSDGSCSDALGCVACAPGKNACDGDHVVACGPDGKPGKTLVEQCEPSTCMMTNGDAACIGPCDPRALAKSYTGCVYYAVDLPQFGLPGPGTTVAADQQFAVAVANPNPVPIDVVVDRDAAQLGIGTPHQSLELGGPFLNEGDDAQISAAQVTALVDHDRVQEIVRVAFA